MGCHFLLRDAVGSDSKTGVIFLRRSRKPRRLRLHHFLSKPPASSPPPTEPLKLLLPGVPTPHWLSASSTTAFLLPLLHSTQSTNTPCPTIKVIAYSSKGNYKQPGLKRQPLILKREQPWLHISLHSHHLIFPLPFSVKLWKKLLLLAVSISSPPISSWNCCLLPFISISAPKHLLSRSWMSPRLPSQYLDHTLLLNTFSFHGRGIEFSLLLLHLGSFSCPLICRCLLTDLIFKQWRAPKPSSPHLSNLSSLPRWSPPAIWKSILYMLLWNKLQDILLNENPWKMASWMSAAVWGDWWHKGGEFDFYSERLGHK